MFVLTASSSQLGVKGEGNPSTLPSLSPPVHAPSAMPPNAARAYASRNSHPSLKKAPLPSAPTPAPPLLPLARQLTASDFMSLRFSHVDNLLGHMPPSNYGGEKGKKKDGMMVTEDARRPGSGKSKKRNSKEEERADAKWADWVRHGWEIAAAVPAERPEEELTTSQKADSASSEGKWTTVSTTTATATSATATSSSSSGSNADVDDKESRLVTPGSLAGDDISQDSNQSKKSSSSLSQSADPTTSSAVNGKAAEVNSTSGAAGGRRRRRIESSHTSPARRATNSTGAEAAAAHTPPTVRVASAASSPFLFCVYSSILPSGATRLPYLLNSVRLHSTGNLGADDNHDDPRVNQDYSDVAVVANTALRSCYVLAMPADVALRVASSSSLSSATVNADGTQAKGKSGDKESDKDCGNNGKKGMRTKGNGAANAKSTSRPETEIRVLPFFDAMKIDSDAVHEVMYGEAWSATSPASARSSSAQLLRRTKGEAERTATATAATATTKSAASVIADAADATESPPLSSTTERPSSSHPPEWEKTLSVGFAPGVLPKRGINGDEGDEAVLRVARSMLDGVQRMAGMGMECRRRLQRRHKIVRRREVQTEEGNSHDEGNDDNESIVGAGADSIKGTFRSLTDSFSVTAAAAASSSSRAQRRKLLTSRRASNATTDEENDRYSENDNNDTDEASHERFWSEIFRRGLESSHVCSSMMSSIVLRPRPYGDGFLVVLNPQTPPSSTHWPTDSSLYNSKNSEESTTNRAPRDEGRGGKKEEREAAVASLSSSDNPYCVLSLLAGLASDRRVLSVSSGGRITGDVIKSTLGMTKDMTGRGLRPPKKEHEEEELVAQVEDRVGETIFRRAGLNGRDQIVAVSDSGLDTKHCLFRDDNGDGYIHYDWDFSRRKVVKYDWIHNEGDHKDYKEGHGTHVAGTVAGKASGKDSDRLPSGVAPDSRIVFFDMRKGEGGMYNPGADILFDSVRGGGNGGRGARVVNGSWGRSNRPYSDFCVDYDGGLYRHDDMVYVASAGNVGDDIKHWGDPSVKDPALCKNVIAVGATYSGNNYEDFVSYSSLGPTLDGRSKPDIVAPGIDVNSAIAGSECTFEEWEGTSMAAPVVTGSVVLIRQYFEEGWYPCGVKNCGSPVVPSGSLLKAVLMNGAQTLQGKVKRKGKPLNNADLKPYDNKQGMGRINLPSSLSLAAENSINTMVVNDKEIGDGQVDEVVIESTCSHEMISVTIAWYDPPSMQSCKECLINDLDLSITRETDSARQLVHDPEYFPNGRKDADTKNNVERIQIKGAKEKETYRIQVKGTNLAKPGTQKYSLVTTGCFRVIGEDGDDSVTNTGPSSTLDEQGIGFDQGNSNSDNNATIIAQSTSLKNSRVKFHPSGNNDGTPKRCKWLAKEDSRMRQFCSEEAGINNLVDAACPETCGKYHRDAPCHDTRLSLGQTRNGEEMTCDWLKANQKEWNKCGRSGEIRNKKADVICPMTCGWCG